MRVTYLHVMLYCVISSAILAYVVIYMFDLNIIEQFMCLLGGGAFNGIVMSMLSSREES